MLENRSFDHMLGLLNHPRRDDFRPFFVEPGEHPNARDLANPREDDPRVTDDGTPHLPTGPPHRHVSAIKQLNRGARKFGMDGFVTAYADEIADHKSIKVRWDVVAVVAVVVIAPLMAAAALEVVERRANGWRGFHVPLLVGGLVATAVVGGWRLQNLPGVRKSLLATVWALLAAGCGFIAGGLAVWFREPRTIIWWLPSAAVWLAVVFGARWWLQRTRRHVPTEEVRLRSADVMRCLRPETKAPALAWLAMRYAVCVRWFSSVPGATWPNRNFAHAGTSDEAVDIEAGFYEDRTIFQVLDAVRMATRSKTKPDWRIYFHDTPQVFAFDALWKDDKRANWFDASQLLQDIADEELATYSFVEPCHRGARENSQHPDRNLEESSKDFLRGDMLIASIYNALVRRPDLMKRTVFVVTYDEHGGFFDHMPPPKAVHPEAPGSRKRGRELARRLTAYLVEYDTRPFPFTHLGARVPAIVVSPWVGDHTIDDTVYDHATIPATLKRLWAASEPRLSRREMHANDVLHLLVDRATAMPPERCTVYDEPDQTGTFSRSALTVVGCPRKQMDVDGAARDDPVPEVLLLDDFSKQLEKLNHDVRAELLSSSEGADLLAALEDAVGADAEPVPTAALFKASAESTRNGNPTLADF